MNDLLGNVFIVNFTKVMVMLKFVTKLGCMLLHLESMTDELFWTLQALLEYLKNQFRILAQYSSSSYTSFPRYTKFFTCPNAKMVYWI